MKKILYILSALAVLASCTDVNFGRIDQKDDNLPAPSPVKITSVTPVSGGAVIKVSLPDDDLIKGVIATYERNGVTVNTKISRYVDTLLIEGYSDTKEHVAQVASFNVNEKQSEAQTVKFTPLVPAIRTVKPVINQTFGGVKINITGNPESKDLAVVLLRDSILSHKGLPAKDMKWVEVTTLFTSSDNINLTKRNIEPVEAIFGVYVRDHWGNISDTTVMVVTPLVEEMLDKSLFSHDKGSTYALDDNYEQTSTNASNYEVQGLWDGTGRSAAHCFFAADSTPIPMWITIDLGQVCTISRIATLPRIDYNIWASAHPRDFEFWGSMDPTGTPGSGEHGFDDTWFLLGKFTQFKPSGYTERGLVGTYTTEDRTYFNAGNDFELDPDECPHAYDQLRYLRVVISNTFESYEKLLDNPGLASTLVGAVQFGEVTPWGQSVNE